MTHIQNLGSMFTLDFRGAKTMASNPNTGSTRLLEMIVWQPGVKTATKVAEVAVITTATARESTLAYQEGHFSADSPSPPYETADFGSQTAIGLTTNANQLTAGVSP